MNNLRRRDTGFGIDILGYGLGVFPFLSVLWDLSVLQKRPDMISIQWKEGVISLGVKRPSRKAEYLSPYRAEPKNECCCTCLRGRYRDHFISAILTNRTQIWNLLEYARIFVTELCK